MQRGASQGRLAISADRKGQGKRGKGKGRKGSYTVYERKRGGQSDTWQRVMWQGADSKIGWLDGCRDLEGSCASTFFFG